MVANKQVLKEPLTQDDNKTNAYPKGGIDKHLQLSTFISIDYSPQR